ncbi:hypothetical protein ACOSQ3_029579 [Xanthoceras sorbifolium]
MRSQITNSNLRISGSLLNIPSHQLLMENLTDKMIGISSSAYQLKPQLVDAPMWCLRGKLRLRLKNRTLRTFEATRD